jgi:hypothetical protein
MKKFKVTASYKVYCHAIVEAEAWEEAERIARDMDGSEFDVDRENGLGDWNIEVVSAALREAE